MTTNTMSETHRLNCEIRWILTLDDLARTKFYAEVMKRRGKEAANALIAAVNAYRRANCAVEPLMAPTARTVRGGIDE